MSEYYLKKIKNIRNILIIVAMDVEKDVLLNGHEYDTIEIDIDLDIYLNRITLNYGRHVIVLKTGVGLVNAALGLALTHKKYPVDAVILLGVGGALVPGLQIGDVVLANHILQHDSVFTGVDGNTFMAPGKLFLTSKPNENREPKFTTDPVLRDWLSAEELIQKYTQRGHALHIGTILSGSEFAANPDRKAVLARNCIDALLVEMEAAAVAQVSEKLGIPFIAVKTVADRLTPEGTIAQEYTNFLQSASYNAKYIHDYIVKTLND